MPKNRHLGLTNCRIAILIVGLVEANEFLNTHEPDWPGFSPAEEGAIARSWNRMEYFGTSEKVIASGHVPKCPSLSHSEKVSRIAMQRVHHFATLEKDVIALGSAMNAGAFLLLLVTPAADPKGRLDLDPEDLKPGLVAEYPSLTDPKAVFSRIEAKPAFTLGRSSPHPRVPTGPFEVIYKGVISIRDSGPVSFSAFVGGELVIKVDGETVLEGRGNTETSQIAGKAKLDRPQGFYRLEIRYRSLADVPARLQIWWEAPSFAREPIPPWRFAHIVTDLSPAAQRDQLAASGRLLAGRFGCARCHAGAMPAVDDPPPGPSLADVSSRLSRRWLFNWLADPTKVRADAHMPALFSPDRAGYIERWLVADYLSGGKDEKRMEEKPGNHRGGRLEYLGLAVQRVTLCRRSSFGAGRSQPLVTELWPTGSPQ